MASNRSFVSMAPSWVQGFADLAPEELSEIPVVCGLLREALGELRADHAFLLKGDVFNVDQIEAYMELKWEEVYAFEHTPHPIEFQMYYSV